MKTLTVKQGKHDFKPSKLPWPLTLKSKVYYFEYVLTESCWYDSLDSDNYDFNKGIGLYQWLDFAKNFNAFIFAWRPKLDQQFYFECVPYENRDKAILANEDKIRVYKAGDVIKGYFKPDDLGCELYLVLEDSVILWHKSKLSSCLYGVVDSWFGGNRYSPQEMNVELFTKIM